MKPIKAILYTIIEENTKLKLSKKEIVVKYDKRRDSYDCILEDDRKEEVGYEGELYYGWPSTNDSCWPGRFWIRKSRPMAWVNEFIRDALLEYIQNEEIIAKERLEQLDLYRKNGRKTLNDLWQSMEDE